LRQTTLPRKTSKTILKTRLKTRDQTRIGIFSLFLGDYLRNLMCWEIFECEVRINSKNSDVNRTLKNKIENHLPHKHCTPVNPACHTNWATVMANCSSHLCWLLSLSECQQWPELMAMDRPTPSNIPALCILLWLVVNGLHAFECYFSISVHSANGWVHLGFSVWLAHKLGNY
jgi:hypothetical protein